MTANTRPGEQNTNASRRKSETRMTVERIIFDTKVYLTRAQIFERSESPDRTTVNAIISDMLKKGQIHGDGEQPAGFMWGPPPMVEPEHVAQPRSIDVWKLPEYVPPAWNVRAGAGEVRNRA